jgi:ABC-type nitrate/sulfonate/bicarbonate transport system permease component
MLGFLLFALVFVGLLTAIVRFARLNVRRGLPETRALLLTAGFVALVFAGWWFVTRGATPEQRIVSKLILPSPVEVLQAFGPLHFEQGLVRSAFTSWVRVTTGFVFAAIVAVPLGVYMATFPPIAAFFRPLALVGAYVPIVLFIPLSLTWFGTGETQKVGFLFIACFVALLPLVIKSVSDVAPAYLDVAVTKGASQWQLVWQVLFPVAKADIWDHLRGIWHRLGLDHNGRDRGTARVWPGCAHQRVRTAQPNARHLCHHHRDRSDCRRLRPTLEAGRPPPVPVQVSLT